MSSFLSFFLSSPISGTFGRTHSLTLWLTTFPTPYGRRTELRRVQSLDARSTKARGRLTDGRTDECLQTNKEKITIKKRTSSDRRRSLSLHTYNTERSALWGRCGGYIRYTAAAAAVSIMYSFICIPCYSLHFESTNIISFFVVQSVLVPAVSDRGRLGVNLTFLLEEDPLRSKALFGPLATSGNREAKFWKLFLNYAR